MTTGLEHITPQEAGGWLAAVGLLLTGFYRSFTVGQRMGTLEQKIDGLDKKFDRIEFRIDKHFDGSGG